MLYVLESLSNRANQRIRTVGKGQALWPAPVLLTYIPKVTDVFTMTLPQIMILGIGNILLTDEGFGVHTLKELHYRYDFSVNVTLVDGGVLGMNLLGVIGDTD